MSFALDLRRITAKAKGDAALVVRRVSFELLSRVVLMSPVDTGRFRANWNISGGGIDTRTTDDVDKGGAEALGRVSAELSAAKFDRPMVIWFTNSLPYARQLEYGYSKQAPAGMVRVSIRDIVSRYGR